MCVCVRVCVCLRGGKEGQGREYLGLLERKEIGFLFSPSPHIFMAQETILSYSKNSCFVYERNLRENVRYHLILLRWSSHCWSETLLNVKFSADHCVKSVQIRSFFWSVFFCIQSEYRKIRTRKYVFRHFTQRMFLSTKIKSQLTFPCSSSAIETVQKGVKYVQS